MPQPHPSPALRAALITAGGQARRYGADKVLARLGGQTLLERVAHSFSGPSLAAPLRVIVSGNAAHTLDGWQTLPDLRPGQGPLAGLERGLRECHRQDGGQDWAGWVAFCAADMPHLTPAFWQVLLEHVQPEAQAVIGLDEHGRLQPLAALYHSSVLPTVSRLLDSQERRMGALLDELHIVQVPRAATLIAAPRAFHNVNTPAELG